MSFLFQQQCNQESPRGRGEEISSLLYCTCSVIKSLSLSLVKQLRVRSQLSSLVQQENVAVARSSYRKLQSRLTSLHFEGFCMVAILCCLTPLHGRFLLIESYKTHSVHTKCFILLIISARLVIVCQTQRHSCYLYRYPQFHKY